MRHSLLGKVAQNKEGRRGDRRPPIRNPVCKHAYSFTTLVAIAPTSNGGGNKYCTKIAVASLTPSRLPGCRRSPPRPPKFNVAAYVGGRRLVVSSTPPPPSEGINIAPGRKQGFKHMRANIELWGGGRLLRLWSAPKPNSRNAPGLQTDAAFLPPTAVGHNKSARPRLSSPLCTRIG